MKVIPLIHFFCNQVTAPALQECTNSHGFNLLNDVIGQHIFHMVRLPTNAEEYVELALRFHAEAALKKLFAADINSTRTPAHGSQIVDLVQKLLHR